MAVRAEAMPRPPMVTRPRRGAVRRALDAVGTVISVVVAVVGALALVLAIATHFVPSSGVFTVAGHPLFAVLSGSMTPVIDTGDLVIDQHVSATQAAQLHAGQIITFDHGGGATPITHRIAAVTGTGAAVEYTTKGDSNTAADRTPVKPSEIMGVYQAKVPMGGRVIFALRQPLTLGLLLAAPALWLLSGFLFAWARELDDNETRGGAR